MISTDLSQLETLKQILPTRKEEAWKYTSLADFKAFSWNSVAEEGSEFMTHDQMQKLSLNLPADFYNLVFVNGILNVTLSDELSDSIQVQTIEDTDLIISDDHPEKNLLKFSNSCLRKKTVVSVTAHQVLQKPIHFLYVQNSKKSLFSSEKVAIHIGKNAEVTLISQTISLDDSIQGSINLNMNLSVDEDARVKFIQIQNENQISYHFAQTEVQLSSNAQWKSLIMTLGGKLIRHYFHIAMSGHGADAQILGLNALGDTQHSDHYTFIQHVKGGNQSRQLFKSVLSDSSHGVFRGRVRIERDAQKASSEQLNNNLLLTREAQADSIPQLEIYADDVKAGHGSTVGQLNKDEIFYFLSRGINQYQAVKMLSIGFAQDLVFQFEDKIVQDWLLKKLNTKLDGMIKNV
ncbi:MAG: Fe-S cluster assembly protein SufD [Bdellovibrionales bacterium RIFCSPHIGHO2_01_FULL_40_29]|nr:MAG: Fe-S cluster assembly protein SufD [Bdellovibrionales bacterium RIFCSPHIGHO2_01_FULL_40_29]OFZ35056.1 MAG: Fe-S cluster assembly protein SufD [Bdellovibrionales bacterium RIFCSPHIGHO2_02_FULL_40_15]